MDNRNKGKTDTELNEILNDEKPLDDSVPAKDPSEDEDPTPETPPVTPPVEETPVEEKKEEEEEIPVVEDKGEEETPAPAQPSTPEEPKVDAAKEQRVENILQNERNNKLLDTIEKAQTVGDPTEEDLRAYAKQKGAEYDDLSVFEQAMLKDSWKSTQAMKALNDGVSDIKNIRAWAEKVDGFLTENASKQAYKGLIGKEDKFRDYAMEASHRGANMELLVDSFLFKNPATAPVRKGALPLATAGGGDNPNPKPDVLDDAEEVANLRKNNPREYARQVRAGKIKVEL